MSMHDMGNAAFRRYQTTGNRLYYSWSELCLYVGSEWACHPERFWRGLWHTWVRREDRDGYKRPLWHLVAHGWSSERGIWE